MSQNQSIKLFTTKKVWCHLKSRRITMRVKKIVYFIFLSQIALVCCSVLLLCALWGDAELHRVSAEAVPTLYIYILGRLPYTIIFRPTKIQSSRWFRPPPLITISQILLLSKTINIKTHVIGFCTGGFRNFPL